MGAQNVALVFTRWGHLHHAPFRALVYMAHRSLDGGNPPRFWGGRDELAHALGRPIPEPYGDEFDKKREADYAMVRKVTKTLTREGAITLDGTPAPGQNAVYILHLRLGGDRTSSPPNGGTSGSEQGDLRFGTVGPQVPPKEKKEPEGLKLGVEGEDDHQPAGVAHAQASGKDNHHHKKQIGEFDYRSASAFLLTLDDDTRAAADAQARAELPDAKREQQIIRAAELAKNGTP